ncbi:MAG: hypothetical protein JSV04_12415 [Candidatus Heimdallarchaeota archaeon]|nr:MAG: hypothetical protein JSV04_12415 [Candidatus Heimdallarchaeota archaeon]
MVAGKSLLETDLLGALVLLVVGIVAIILVLLLLKEYMATKKPYHLAWAVSFLVLFISGVLIIFLGWEDTLASPLVPPVAAFIPACLAIGLVFAVWPDAKYGFIYAIYCLIVIGVLTLMKLDVFLSDMASMAVMGSHIPSGLIISFLPLYTAFVSKDTEWTSAFFGIGGLLISFGGVLLAIATVGDGNPDLLLLIFDILPYLLLIVGVLFVLGIGLPSKWKVEIPVISGLF